jgi:hypothetical protein
LRCADIHPVRCEEVFAAASPDDLVARVCDHGAGVHGFTPAFYSHERLSAITATAARV